MSSSGPCSHLLLPRSVWDLATVACRLTLAGHTKSVTSVLISADGLLLLSLSRDYTMRCGFRV